MKTEFFAKLLEAAKLTGLKTYIAGLGLVALGVYQISDGQVDTGYQTILEGVAVAGFRAAVAKI
jgi:hypothetical protein